MRKWIVLFLVLLLLSGTAKASEILEQQAEIYGMDQLEKNIPDKAEELLGPISLDQKLNVSHFLSELVSDAVRGSEGTLRSAATLILRILMIVLLCCMAEVGRSAQLARVSVMAGGLALMLCCVSDLKGMLRLGMETVQEMMDFSKLLVPVMASASAASGMAGSAGAMYGLAVFFSNVLLSFTGSLLPPLIYGYLALALTDTVIQEDRMKKLREMIGAVIRWCLKGAVSLFTGFLAITGILTGHADAMTLKAAKVTISGMIPIVGGIISDAAETLMAGAGLLKGAAGTYGMLAILIVFAAPFLQTAVYYLAFRMTAVLGSLVGSRLGALMDAITASMGFVLAMLGSGAVMCMLSCCCFMRVVGV